MANATSQRTRSGAVIEGLSRSDNAQDAVVAGLCRADSNYAALLFVVLGFVSVALNTLADNVVVFAASGGKG